MASVGCNVRGDKVHDIHQSTGMPKFLAVAALAYGSRCLCGPRRDQDGVNPSVFARK